MKEGFRQTPKPFFGDLLHFHGESHLPFFFCRFIIFRHPVVFFGQMAGKNRREGDGIGRLSERISAGKQQRTVRLRGDGRTLREHLSVGYGELEIKRRFARFKRVCGGNIAERVTVISYSRRANVRVSLDSVQV